jgi:WhiB family transcriptional regulator, redox-sensing transcriptional regulator
MFGPRQRLSAAGSHKPDQRVNTLRANRGGSVSLLATSFALGAADHSWRDQALCRDTDPELFFPIGTTGFALLQLEKARQVCGECQVRAECLEFALETNQDSGIWGGLSEEERRVIRRQRARQARAQRAG